MVVRYLLADALSLLGNAIAFVVLPWLVLVRSGDAAAAGLVAAATALPMLLAAIVGGLVVDRVGRRLAARFDALADALPDDPEIERLALDLADIVRAEAQGRKCLRPGCPGGRTRDQQAAISP